MVKTRVARIFSFILALTLVFACMSPSSYALSKQQFSAWVAAALQAINITATATATGAADASRDLMDWLSAPVKIVANQFVDVPYTTPIENIDEYLSRSTLKIDKDKVTIDGVEYTDVWLSNEAAEKFRVNAFDIENAFDIASQSEGTFVSGIGRVVNTPIFQVGSNKISQLHEFLGPTYSGMIANCSVNQREFDTDSGTRYNFNIWDITTQQYIVNGNYTSSQNPVMRLQVYPNNSIGLQHRIYDGTFSNYTYLSDPFIAEPFDFDWVSGTIPIDEVLPEDEGLRIRVPTEDIANWYTDYPETGDSVTINMGDPDLEAKVDDLIDLIIPLIPVLDIDFTTNETPEPEPEPEPEPVPDPEPYPDPLPDPDISLIDGTLKDIIQALKNIYDSIATGNTFSEAIKNLNDKINWSLDDIKEKIGDLANKIETGSADFFRDIVQSIWQPFLPIFNVFRAGVGIWHYVIEWLEYIHTPFVTFWNFLGSAGYIFLTPIYATAAAAIVIAIYRRFGR